MNCDPNTLSKAASCLFCGLSDYQLNLARIRTLCAWLGVAGGHAPGAPTNPDITDASQDVNVVVTWTNPSPAATTNEVWRSVDGGTNYFLFTTVAGNVSQAADNSIIPNNTIYYYKIRSCSGASCSAFTNPVGISNNFVSPNVASISFPFLVRAANAFTASGLAALTSVSLPKLRTVQNNFDLSNNTNLASISLPVLNFVGFALFLGSDKITGAFSLPALTTIGGDFQIQNNILMTSFSVPLLTSVGGNLVMSGLAALTSVTLTSLNDVGVGFANGRLDFQNDDALASISFPALTQVFSEIDFNGCAILTSIQLPNLTNITGDNIFIVSGSTCPLLTTWNAPNWFVSDSFSIDLSANALNAASVNQVLARGVASGVLSCQFTLNGGTNAAPSGQGIVDKAALIVAGNTVNTN